ncbi:MAG: phosphate transport system regulatory protein PhoU [Omnitrophica bacterium RIFCSPLOWO2_01_FULL_50_24]|nr:MAG: phosphate transport system regulatory protein PhoU [Omnitrophica bacterium RIFCSPLOWO2_01_FULL_50_24]
MQRYFDEELKKLKDTLFRMGDLVERAIRKAADSLETQDRQKAKEVIEEDQKINILEIEIDEFGHELIARMQPTAVDLRLITMVLKITGDLERIGDQAVNIAQEGLERSPNAGALKQDLGFSKGTDLAIQMVKGALEAFANRDAKIAKSICEGDDELDNWNREVNLKLQQAVETGKVGFSEAIGLIMVAHNLERIGDLATNIAEDVIYVAKGIDIRHHITERRASK